MNELDLNITNLVRAISMGESGGQDNPTSRITRTEGSKGTLQFLPATFKTYGDRYLGGKALNGQDLDINDPSHQRLVAYKYIEDKYNQKNPDGTRKYTAGDIVASWNAGEGRIQSWQNHRGVNQYGNAYDTPAYVAKVGQFYNAIKAQNPPQTSSPTVGQEPDNVAQAGINFAKDVFAGITRPAESIKNAATTYGGAAVSTLLGNMFGDKGATFDDYVNMNKRNLAENSLTQALGGEAPNNPDLSTLKGYGQLAGDIGQTAFNVAGGGVAKGAAKTVAEDAAAKYLSKFAPGLLKSAGLGYGYDVSSNLSDTGDATDWGTYKPGVGLGVGLALPLTSGAVRAAFTPLQKLQEDAFISGVSDLRNRTKTTENSFTKNTIVRPQADGTKQVITPLDNWFSNKIPLPEVSTEGGTAKVKTLLPGGPVETIQKYIDTLDDKTLQEAIGSGLQLNTQDIKAVANKIVNDSYIQDVANGKLKRSDVLSKVQDRLDNLTEEYSKNGVWDGESIRKALKSANRDYSDETKDITRLVGDTMRDILYTQTPTGKQNLGALQELYSMQNFARDIDGKVVTGGGLGRYMARMLGAMVGNNLPGSGAFGLGPIIGSVIGDKAQKAIQKASFTSAPAELKGLVQKLKNLGASDKDIEEYIYKPYSSKADIVPINKQTAKNAATNITNPDTIDKANQATAEQSLIQEAKKYKSAEEFIKAQPTVYHGTNTKFDVFDKSKIGEVTGVGDWGDGFYFSDNKDVAKSFAKDAGGDIVMEVSLKNLKFADGNKLEKLPEVQDILDDGMGFTDIGEYLKSKGYDGVKYKHKEGGGTEYVVYDADKIKTKSQLTDIWNKANQATAEQSLPLSSKSEVKYSKPIEDNLVKEAKKYKSAEEFVKAQGTPVYHGGTEIKEVGNMRSKWGAFYMTDNPTYAKSYGGNKSFLNEMVITPEAKLADLRKPSSDIVKQIEDIISPKKTGKTFKIQKPDGSFIEVPETKGGLSNPVHSSADIIQGIKDGKAYYAEMPEVKEALKKLGYDGQITSEVPYAKNIGVWNKEVIKTKSQLTDIWNKANDSMNGILPQPTAGVNTQSVDIPQNQSLRDFLLKKQPYVPEQYVPDNKLPVIDFGPKAKSKYTQDVNKDLPVIRSLVGLGTVGAAGIAGLNQTEAATQDSAQSRSQLDNDATTTIGKVKIPSKDNPLYSAYDNEISNAEGLVKSKLGITLPKGLVKTIIATESGFGTDDRSYNPKLGQNAWLVGLTADAKKELANRLKGDYGVDPALINSDTIQGAINSAALYIALKSRVSKGQDSTGSKIIDDVVQKQLLSDPVKLYSTKYSNRSKDAQKAFETRYKYIKEN